MYVLKRSVYSLSAPGPCSYWHVNMTMHNKQAVSCPNQKHIVAFISQPLVIVFICFLNCWQSSLFLDFGIELNKIDGKEIKRSLPSRPFLETNSVEGRGKMSRITTIISKAEEAINILKIPLHSLLSWRDPPKRPLHESVNALTPPRPLDPPMLGGRSAQARRAEPGACQWGGSRGTGGGRGG